MNEMAYNFHYRNLDSTLHYSNLVLKKAGNYDGARAEAFNNKAFVSIMRMDYPTATRQLDSVATITPNRPEWNFLDMAIMQIGALHVAIYPTISESDYRYIFDDANVKLVFVAGWDLLRKITQILDDKPDLKAARGRLGQGVQRHHEHQ